MNSKSDKGCHILYERQERISKEKGQRIYIKNTQTEVRELFRRTADKNNTASKKARDQIQQKACKLNQQIKQEIEQLKLLSHNILQNPVESKASESDMEMHDNKAEARQSLSRSQDNDTESSQEDLSYRTVGLIKKRITRVEGGCNYISRQRGTNHDQNTRSVYQCDFGNPSRFIAYFPGAQRQFRDDDNCVCCALRASVPIPLLTSQNCRYQPSWECVSSRPLSPRTATDPYTELFCRNWCSCIPPVSTLKCKQKSRRNSEEPCGSKSRSSSKAGKSLDDKMRKKVKKSGAKIDSASLDQYRVQSSEKLLMVTMKKEPKSLSAARQRQSKARAGEEISQTGMEKSTSADKQSDESKDSMYRDYMDKYRKENGNAEKDRRAANLAQDYAQVDGFSDGCGPGYCETDPICSADKRIGWGRAECHTKKCVCIAQESQTDEEYTEHRYAQEQAQVDGSEPKSGQEGVRPEGNVDLEESANDERGDGDERYVDRCGPGYCDKDPMSSPDNQVERSRGVCVSQEVQTDEESIKKETTLTQTDLQSLEKPTQTDLQGSKHETLTQTDPELSHQISTGMSPISGATIKESNYDFVRQSESNSR
ncbi:uncharacterized protein LOC117893188 [Drosophila subobscura]|uniref:uncharacterized protein LOC117893188 n=1 Tax=Drosophila subobscura TaxID=7241 RepID=UPI00155A9BAF|nr:uncharacterized protein LOC117893188 [Drosophila subobscura]